LIAAWFGGLVGGAACMPKVQDGGRVVANGQKIGWAVVDFLLVPLLQILCCMRGETGC